MTTVSHFEALGPEFDDSFALWSPWARVLRQFHTLEPRGQNLMTVSHFGDGWWWVVLGAGCWVVVGGGW